MPHHPWEVEGVSSVERSRVWMKALYCFQSSLGLKFASHTRTQDDFSCLLNRSTGALKSTDNFMGMDFIWDAFLHLLEFGLATSCDGRGGLLNSRSRSAARSSVEVAGGLGVSSSDLLLGVHRCVHSASGLGREVLLQFAR